MSSQQWNEVDCYLGETLQLDNPLLEGVLERNQQAGLPAIDVSPLQGKLLHLLARMQGARRILEIGTLGGYSTIWLASALPADGQLVTLEYVQEHAAVARTNIAAAGLADKVQIRIGAALDILPQLREQPPFDLVFIDADKPNYPGYVDWAVRLTRPGSAIVLDNVVRRGAVVDADSNDPNVDGTRAALRWLGQHPRLQTTAVQTVGAKGWDGFALAIVQ